MAEGGGEIAINTNSNLHQNWLKAIHYLFIARKGLKNLVIFVARLLQENALDLVLSNHSIERERCVQCTSQVDCRTKVYEYVIGMDRYTYNQQVQNRNDSLRQKEDVITWCSNSWSIATTFMPTYYKNLTRESVDNTDLIGLLHFMNKCKLFTKFIDDHSICKKVRVYYNKT